MWALVFIVLVHVPGMPKEVVLHKYDTIEECRENKAYVEAGMKEAYPKDEDYKIECKWKPQYEA